MNRRSRVTVTIVVALITILLSTVCSAVGIYVLTDHGVARNLHPAVGISLVAVGVAVWVGPPLLSVLPADDAKRDRIQM